MSAGQPGAALRGRAELDGLFLMAYQFAERGAKVRSARVIERLQAMALDRDDLEQEALIGVWMALRRFDPARASLRTYVERVVATRIASVFRRAKSQKRAPMREALHAPAPLRFAVGIELRLDFDRVLAKLEPRDRRVAELLGEHRPARVAPIVGISRAGVYRSMDRIEPRFRKLVSGGNAQLRRRRTRLGLRMWYPNSRFGGGEQKRTLRRYITSERPQDE